MKKKYWIAVISAVVVIVVAAGIAFILNSRRAEDEETSQQDASRERVGSAVRGEGTVSLDDDWLNGDESYDIGENTFAMTMLSTIWRFEDGDSPSYDVSIVNDPINENPVYLELVLDDGTDEVLFSSDYLEPGDAIHGIELGKHLDKGEYDCVLNYHLMDQEKKVEEDTVKLAITVVIEN